MKKITTLLILLLLAINVLCQDYYYNGNAKKKIFRSEESFISFEKLDGFLLTGFAKVKHSKAKGFTVLEGRKAGFKESSFKDQSVNQVSKAIKFNPDSKFEMYLTKTVKVKLRQNVSKTDILSLLSNG